MQCPTHPEIHVPPGRICIMCSRQNYKDWVRSEKQKRVDAKVMQKKSFGVSGNELTKLKNKLQSELRKVIHPYYENLGLTNFCWICNRRLLKGKNQVMHFYAKSEIWQLWCHPVNLGIGDYDCNVNKPHTVTSMEAQMVRVWGLDRVKELKALRDFYKERIDTGQDPRHPTKLWLIGMIADVKNLNPKTYNPVKVSG